MDEIGWVIQVAVIAGAAGALIYYRKKYGSFRAIFFEEDDNEPGGKNE